MTLDAGHAWHEHVPAAGGIGSCASELVGKTVTASLTTCRKTLSLEAGSVYAWETAEGVTGNIVIDPDGSVARPCTVDGIILGGMLLDKNVGDLENPDPDPKIRRSFLIAASVIIRERERQGRLPDKIMRTYW
ncbi:hypothetical protein ACFY9A_34355 [Streptomyces rubradiris]|uniref:hypothetical protein n=1 Tax=Streptomyces rubradiris TaxID=285531 RepID=UPI0036E54A0B